MQIHKFYQSTFSIVYAYFRDLSARSGGSIMWQPWNLPPGSLPNSSVLSNDLKIFLGQIRKPGEGPATDNGARRKMIKISQDSYIMILWLVSEKRPY